MSFMPMDGGPKVPGIGVEASVNVPEVKASGVPGADLAHVAGGSLGGVLGGATPGIVGAGGPSLAGAAGGIAGGAVEVKNLRPQLVGPCSMVLQEHRRLEALRVPRTYSALTE
jgi:hypothetical protein